jgi:hypothetical protein
MPTLTDLLHQRVPLPVIAAHLDALSPAARVAGTNALPAKLQALLFELAQGSACTLDRDFVPGAAPLTEVIHDGRNSLPLFRHFQKRFTPARPADGHVAWGYNEQAMQPFTGPGYFVAREEALDGTPTVVIDYERPAQGRAPGWPEIRPNSARLGRFVYFGTQDWMWRVSSHVTIGRARRKAGWMDNWFVLCRRG